MSYHDQLPCVFIARTSGDGIKTIGPPTCHLGHKLEGGAFHDCDGIYADWTWDGEKLVVKNDRYGFYPIFYCAYDGAILVSSSIRSLVNAGAPTDVDGPGLAVFLRIGFFIGNDTPFRYVKALPPNALLQWHNGKLTISSSRPCSRPANLSRQQLIDGFISLFRAAIRRRLPQDGNFVVPLSGGRDSRHILLELLEAGCRPKFCITSSYFPDTPSQDTEVALRLANYLKLDHVVVEQTQRWCEAEARKNITTDLLADEHAWLLVMADYLDAQTTILYDGIAGDVLSAGLFLDKERLDNFESENFVNLARSLLGTDNFGCYKIQETTLEHLVGVDWYKRFSLDVAVNHLSEEIAKHANTPNPVGSFFFWNRTRREIALSPFRILGMNKTVFAPYVDHELYDFLSSIPAGQLLDHNLHTETIQRAYPKYAGFPFDNKTGEEADTKKIFVSRTRQLVRHMMSHRQRKGILLQRGYLLPRLLSCITTGRTRGWWPNPALVLYLFQLESLLDTPSYAANV